MRRKLVFLIIVFHLIGCSKKQPTEPAITTTTTTDITFSKATLDTFWYESDSWYDSLNWDIQGRCLISSDGGPYLLDTIIALRTDTLTWYMYLSNGKYFHRTNTNWGSLWPPLVLTTGVCVYSADTNTPYNLVWADTATTIDSVIVTYTYWRNHLRNGPYRNKYRNPPIKRWFW
jgi:hypothetical protein